MNRGNQSAALVLCASSLTTLFRAQLIDGSAPWEGVLNNWHVAGISWDSANAALGEGVRTGLNVRIPRTSTDDGYDRDVPDMVDDVDWESEEYKSVYLRTPTNTGWLGIIKTREGRDIGDEAFIANIDGNYMEVPYIVPGLTDAEILHISDAIDDTMDPDSRITTYAKLIARDKVRAGESPFKEPKESINTPEKRKAQWLDYNSSTGAAPTPSRRAPASTAVRC